MRLGSAPVVGLAGLVIAVAFALRLLVPADWDPTVFTAFGEEAIATTEYAEERLGREVVTRPHQGHDGKFFFVQANDPWVLEPEENLAVIDRPLYRGQRMLYPALAGGLGVFSADAVVWALLVVNLLAMAAGSWAVAVLASQMSGSTWWGLAFVFNPGFMSEMNVDGAGVVAAAAALWALAMVGRDRIGWAVVFLAGSALAREAMLIVAAGLAVWMWRKAQRSGAVIALAAPIAAVTVWAIYLRMRFGWDAGLSEVQEIGWPFLGIIAAVPGWLDDPVDLAGGVATILILVMFARRTVRSAHPLGWGLLGFVPLAFLFTQQVWQSYFDITRAIAPVITAFVLLIFLDTDPRRQHGQTSSPAATGVTGHG